MMTMDVSSNYKKLSGSLDKLGKKQLPFAFSKTLNDTMFAVRKHVVEKTYPRSFDVRDLKFFTASMVVDESNHRTAAGLSVTLRDKLGRGNLQLHATGGTKTGRAGRLAIPSRYTKERRGTRGVRKPLRPREVVQKPKGFFAERFSGGSKAAIFQRYGRGAKKLRLLYTVQRSAKIRKRFRFYEDAQRITKQVSQKLFKKNFAHAVKTARR